MSRLVRGATEVRWARGALIVRHPSGTVLVDVPSGIEEDLGEALGELSAIVLTSGRIRTTAGLLGLLAALEPHRDPELPLRLHVPWGEERGAALADTWSRLWPGRFPVEVDAERAGAVIEVGEIEITTHPIRAGEPHWQQGTVEAVPAVALTLVFKYAPMGGVLIAFQKYNPFPRSIFENAVYGLRVAGRHSQWY